jgi:hypothetical protein
MSKITANASNVQAQTGNQNKPFEATPEKSSIHKIIAATTIKLTVRIMAAGTIQGFPYQTTCLLLELN